MGQSRAEAGNRIAAEASPLSQLTTLSQRQRCRLDYNNSPPCFAFQNNIVGVFFRISCFILLDQSLSHSCTVNVLRMTRNALPRGGGAVAAQLSGLSGLWELTVSQLSSDAAEPEPTTINCVANFPPVPANQRQLLVSVSTFQTQTALQPLQLLLGVTRAFCLAGACGAGASETVPHHCGCESSQQEATFWLC